MARRKAKSKTTNAAGGNDRCGGRLWHRTKVLVLVIGTFYMIKRSTIALENAGRELSALSSLQIYWNRPGSNSSGSNAASSTETSTAAAAVVKYLREQLQVPWGNDDENDGDSITSSEQSAIEMATPDPCHETTIVITTNMIPVAPSVAMINATIHSLHHLHGLCNTSKIMIVCDELPPQQSQDSARFHEYIANLVQTFGWQHHVKIVLQQEHLQLANSVYTALQWVKTEFFYVLQHDMPFLQNVNHTALVNTFREYPDHLKIVRFNLRPNIQRAIERHPESCYNMSTPVNHVNGIELTKTHRWSDNNHFTTTKHYHEIFEAIFYGRPNPRDVKAMEHVMNHVVWKNCSYWGQFYYGPYGAPPFIGHLDGRQTLELSNVNLTATRRWRNI